MVEVQPHSALLGPQGIYLMTARKGEGKKNGQNTAIPALQCWSISVASLRAMQTHLPAKDMSQDFYTLQDQDHGEELCSTCQPRFIFRS